MKSSRVWPFVCVAFVSFVAGGWFGSSGQFGISTAHAEAKSDSPAELSPKVRSLQFVDERGLVKGELVIRDTKVDGRPTIQLAIVDPQGRDLWSHPSPMRIIPAR
jgi:hypothetical protein